MKHSKYGITEDDYLLANRRANRLEEIEKHGKQVWGRTVAHKSMKGYSRKNYRISMEEI